MLENILYNRVRIIMWVNMNEDFLYNIIYDDTQNTFDVTKRVRYLLQSVNYSRTVYSDEFRKLKKKYKIFLFFFEGGEGYIVIYLCVVYFLILLCYYTLIIIKILYVFLRTRRTSASTVPLFVGHRIE